MIAVGESETKHQATSRLDAECVDQLFSQQPHRRRAQDHHPLFMKPNNPFVRAKVEKFGELKRFGHVFTIPWRTAGFNADMGLGARCGPVSRPRWRVRLAGEQTNVLNTRNRRASKRRLITRLGAIARSAGSNSRRYTDP